jgi:hypothetical protein
VQSIAFTMTMPRETFSRLVAAARSQRCPKGYIVRMALDEWLDKHSVKPDPSVKTTAEKRTMLAELIVTEPKPKTNEKSEEQS